MFKQVYSPLPDQMTIGLSLSYCIKDLIEDKLNIDQIACIVSGTNIRSDSDWDYLLKAYSQMYWSAGVVRAVHYVRFLKDQGRIIQPRLVSDTAFNIADGHWLVQDKN